MSTHLQRELDRAKALAAEGIREDDPYKLEVSRTLATLVTAEATLELLSWKEGESL